MSYIKQEYGGNIFHVLILIEDTVVRNYHSKETTYSIEDFAKNVKRLVANDYEQFQNVSFIIRNIHNKEEFILG